MSLNASKPKIYIHVGEATHFLRWELPEFSKYFEIVEEPNTDIPILVFGPDVLEEAIHLPARKRYAVLFPGFGHNPVYNKEIRQKHKKLISQYNTVFINPGPLEIAYKGLKNIKFYPFSVDVQKVKYTKPRTHIKKIIHISSDYPQKDWQRSEEIMKKTKLNWEVYPSRASSENWFSKFYDAANRYVYNITSLEIFKKPPHGYVSHAAIIRKYKKNDAFIHVAKDIKDPIYIDGKYTATLIEAGLSGCIIFWHDTFGLGNTLETVFELPLDTNEAASMITEISKTINVKEHSLRTHQEMLKKFNPVDSVKVRANAILNDIKVA
jgi:hypothetical protein